MVSLTWEYIGRLGDVECVRTVTLVPERGNADSYQGYAAMGCHKMLQPRCMAFLIIKARRISNWRYLGIRHLLRISWWSFSGHFTMGVFYYNARHYFHEILQNLIVPLDWSFILFTFLLT